MYRIMFSDLDETLLVNHHVPKVNQEAIFKAREKGLKFVPCTGRAFKMIPEILKEIGTYDQEEEYSLCFNGGLIVENKNNKILHFKGLEFDIAKKILSYGLIPIIEPEVDIHSVDKEKCEEILKKEIFANLDKLDKDQKVMLKLTIPSQEGFYSDVIAHDNVLRVVALSGGYTREDSNEKLAKNPGLIASFSRALTEGLNAGQTEKEFDDLLEESIDSIYQASIK